ncbi:hypothetical protein P7C70_g7840, partial [Phenoliferia sp. Uapishka_3]
MRPSTSVLLTLALPALLAASPDGGSLGALISRLGSDSDNAPVTPSASKAPSNSSFVVSTPKDVTPSPKAGKSSVHRSGVRGGDLELTSFLCLCFAAPPPPPSSASGSGRMVQKKRWIWGTSIIQDDSPDAGTLPTGDNLNLLTPGQVAADTPTANLVAPTFPALTTTTPAPIPTAVAFVADLANPKVAQAVTTSSSSHKKKHRKSSSVANSSSSFSVPSSSSVSSPLRHKARSDHHSLAKKWVWGTSIIQDGDVAPSSSSPLYMIYVNSNTFSSPPAESANTPEATLVAPTFPPLAAVTPSTSAALSASSIIVSVVNATNSSTTSSAVNSPAVVAVNSAVVVALAEANREAMIQMHLDSKEKQRARIIFSQVSRSFFIASDSTSFYVGSEAQAKALMAKLTREKKVRQLEANISKRKIGGAILVKLIIAKPDLVTLDIDLVDKLLDAPTTLPALELAVGTLEGLRHLHLSGRSVLQDTVFRLLIPVLPIGRARPGKAQLRAGQRGQ